MSVDFGPGLQQGVLLVGPFLNLLVTFPLLEKNVSSSKVYTSFAKLSVNLKWLETVCFVCGAEREAKYK